MQINYQDLASETLNWNAAVGSISAISLCKEEPAVNLYGYKFFLDRAVWFDIFSEGRKLLPEKAQVKWYPHKMEATYHYQSLTLVLCAFFIDNEVLTIRYNLRQLVESCSLEMVINGISRNGEDKDKYFHYDGQVERTHNYCVVRQNIDIPDYRMKPVGPFTYHKHHMFWIVNAGRELEVSESDIETKHYFSSQGFNKSNFWYLKKAIPMGDPLVTEGSLMLGVRWMGVESADKTDIRDLKDRMDSYTDLSFDVLEKRQVDFWDDLLGKVPPMKEKYRNNREYDSLYLTAWTCIWQNITGSLVTARKTIKGPSAFVGKAAPNGFGHAQWETSLVGLLTGYMDSAIGIGIIESVINSTEEDGFIPEDLIFNRDVHLSAMEAFVLEGLYKKTGRTDILEKNYDKLLKNIVFHIKHPGFYYLDIYKSTWSLMYSFYSLQSMERIAVAIGKEHGEIRKLRTIRNEVLTEIEDIWDKVPEDSILFEALYGYASSERTSEIIKKLREQHITTEDKYFIHAYPNGKKNEKEDLDSYKMVHYLFFILGLEKLHEDELLDLVTEKTFKGLKYCGDFYECYYVTGEPWGNGPMGIFGAFGWIWCVMDK